jgi:hypothetical protein
VLTWTVTPDSDSGVSKIVFHGALTAETLLDLRSAVLKCLVDSPAAIVVDLGDCHAEPLLSLPMLPTMQHRARDQGVRLLYTADEGLASRIHRDAARWFVELYPSLAEAEAAALEPGTHRWFRIELDPQPLAGVEARVQVGYLCTAWDAPHVAHSACVIVSELVNNAVEHARTRSYVTIAALRGILHIRVRDLSFRQPAGFAVSGVDPAASVAVRGEGLSLVEQHANAWGVTPTETGKIVWATIRIRPIGSKETVRINAAVLPIDRGRTTRPRRPERN